jgi:hypothetical protein
MADGLSGMIKELRRMREGIEEAILAMERAERVSSPVPSSDAPAVPAVVAEGTNRRSEAQKKRWAAKKRAAKRAASAKAETAPVKRKGSGLTEEGRKKLSDAMKQRWAAKNAGSAVKKAARKKAA